LVEHHLAKVDAFAWNVVHSEGWSESAEALAKADRPKGPSYGWQPSLEMKLPAVDVQS